MSEVAAMNGEVKVYVRYNGTNLIPINCHGNETVYDLAEKMKQNAAKFGLEEDAIKINTLRLHLRNDEGKKRKLNFNEEISVVTEKCTVEFGKDEKEVRCFVSFINSENIEFKCKTDKRVSELITDIKERLNEFKLEGTAETEARGSDYQIILNTEDSYFGEGKTIDKHEIIGNLDSTNFKFCFRRDIEKIQKRRGYLRIAFFGAPCHGKSSTINTIYKVLQGESEKSVASTWSNVTSGTKLLTPYCFDGVDRKFTCVDVPGSAMRELSRHEYKHIISDILDGKIPINETMGYWSWFSPKAWGKYYTKAKIGTIHAIVYVHKGDAPEVDGYASEILEVSQLKGIGIPVFGVVTHIDKLETEEKINKACKKLSLILGIDESKIFTITNTDHCKRKSHLVNTKNRSEDVTEMLDVILSAAENVMVGGRLYITDNKC